VANTILNAAYKRLGDLLKVSGGLLLNKIQGEVIPTHDLSRLAAYELGNFRVYSFAEVDLIADSATNLDLNDTSDWTQVTVDGAITTEDVDPTWDKVILWIGGRSVLNVSNWTSSFCDRNGLFGFAVNVATGLYQWTNVNNNNRFIQEDPIPWPIRLSIGENLLTLGTNIATTGGGNETSVSYIVVCFVAPPGLLGPF